MKHRSSILGALCIAVCALSSSPLLADGPQRVTLELALKSTTVSLGEPVILTYKVTNSEDKEIATSINHDPRQWLNMELDDQAGQPTQTTLSAAPLLNRAGSTVAPNGTHTGSVLVTAWTGITHIGHYTLKLVAHEVVTWSVPTGEVYTTEQTYSLPLTVTPKDPAQLRAVAEGLRQAVLEDKDIGDAQMATETLFSMRAPECLPVWRELATDSQLNTFRAADVVRALAKVGTVEAIDILAQMQTVAPERWSQAGLSPMQGLDGMRGTANPKLKDYIDRILADMGLPPGHPGLGSAGGLEASE